MNKGAFLTANPFDSFFDQVDFAIIKQMVVGIITPRLVILMFLSPKYKNYL
jgi:hypothetical protein